MAKKGEKDVKVEEDAAKAKYTFSGIYDYVVHKLEQFQMSSHLIKCFQKMEPFPYKKVASIREHLLSHT